MNPISKIFRTASKIAERTGNGIEGFIDGASEVGGELKTTTINSAKVLTVNTGGMLSKSERFWELEGLKDQTEFTMRSELAKAQLSATKKLFAQDNFKSQLESEQSEIILSRLAEMKEDSKY